MFSKTNDHRNINSESGAILIFAVSTMIVFIILTAIVVDVGHARLVSARLSNIADAAALAATNELNSDLPSWIAAKRASLLAIKASNIRSFRGELDSLGSANSVYPGYSDTQELGSPYASSEYSVGNLHVKIERGFYYSEDGGCTYKFESFEDDADEGSGSGFTTSVLPEIENVTCPCNLAQVANATRVELTLTSVPAIFATAFPGGTDSFTVKEEAISARRFLLDTPPGSC